MSQSDEGSSLETVSTPETEGPPPGGRSFSREALRAKLRENRIKWHVLTRNRLVQVCLVFVCLLVLAAVVAPYVVPHPEDVGAAVHPQDKLQSPSLRHPFGTDELGRDLFSRVVYGTRISLTAAVVTIAIALLIGIPLGALAGGVGGWVDDLIMRITDVFMSFPSVMLAIAIVAFLGSSLQNAIMAIAISWWPWYTRLLRSQAVTLRERQYVRAARAIGTPSRVIIFRHILPNALGPCIVQASLDLGSVILMLAALSFLGLGAQSPTPEWGLLVTMSRNYFLEAWWYMTFPGLAITITVLAFNVLGDGVREVLDPRSRTY